MYLRSRFDFYARAGTARLVLLWVVDVADVVDLDQDRGGVVVDGVQPGRQPRAHRRRHARRLTPFLCDPQVQSESNVE